MATGIYDEMIYAKLDDIQSLLIDILEEMTEGKAK